MTIQWVGPPKDIDNDPYEYTPWRLAMTDEERSDAFEREVERIMHDPEAMADVLEVDMARPIAEFAAYCLVHRFIGVGRQRTLAPAAEAAIEAMVRAHLDRERKEAGLE